MRAPAAAAHLAPRSWLRTPRSRERIPVGMESSTAIGSTVFCRWLLVPWEHRFEYGGASMCLPGQPPAVPVMPAPVTAPVAAPVTAAAADAVAVPVSAAGA